MIIGQTRNIKMDLLDKQSRTGDDARGNSNVSHEIMSPTVFHGHTDTATRMLERRRQLFEVQEALESKKDEFARKMDAFRQRENELRQEDLRLQESLIKFNKFLQENENKRTRAMKRCADENRQCEEKEKEIAKLQQLLETNTAEEQNLAKQLAKHKRYHEYLLAVVDHVQGSDDFLEVQDILDRHKTLKKTNDDLLTKQKQNEDEHEKRRTAYLQYMKDSTNEMLNMSNEIAGLQKELERVTIASHNAENLNSGSSQVVTEQRSDLGQIFLAIDNIIERFEFQSHCTSREKDKKQNVSKDLYVNSYGLDEESEAIKRTKALTKLEKIAEYMIDYKSIADEWDRQEDKKRNT